MNRFEKKCLIASSAMHGFLLLVVVFGSAFFTVKTPPAERQLNVVPGRLVDEALSGGGGNPSLPRTNERIKGDTLMPTASTPASDPTPPTPVPTTTTPTRPVPPPVDPAPPVEPPPTKKTEVAPKTPKPPKAVAKDPVKPVVKETPPKPTVDLKDLVPISRTETAKRRQQEEEDAARQRERERVAAQRAAQAAQAAHAAKVAQARRDAARALTGIGSELTKGVEGLKSGFKGGTAVDVGGPGGEAFANYRVFVQNAYDNAWVVVPELTDSDFIAVVKVTVARDGRIVSSRIVKPSGSSIMDRTVRKALDDVRQQGLPPFPEGSKDSERTFTIEFNLKARSRLG